LTRYLLSEDAVRDLDGIWAYIAANNVDAADRSIAKLFDAFDAVGDTPGIGHKREDLTAYPVLFWPVDAYLVIYRATSNPVESGRNARSARYSRLLAPQIFPVIHLSANYRGYQSLP
jgi:toxin ParE1/3/4